jgi:hypothetical protein
MGTIFQYYKVDYLFMNRSVFDNFSLFVTWSRLLGYWSTVKFLSEKDPKSVKNGDFSRKFTFGYTRSDSNTELAAIMRQK